MSLRTVVAPEVRSVPTRARTRSAGPSGRLLSVLSVAGGTAAIGWHATRYGNWLIDDAAITFAYARSAAEGLGPVVQPGAETVEGFSNPTWMVLLAVGRLLGWFDHGAVAGIPDYVLFPKLLALACCAGVLTAFHLAARRVARRPWLVTAAAGAALAANPSFVIWCFSGLENSLFALTVVWLAVLLFLGILNDRLLTRRAALLAGGLAALAALTRPDGLIYAGAYPLIALVQWRSSGPAAVARHAALSTVAFGLPVGTFLCWRYLTFGRLVSNPSVAKSQGMPELEDLTRPGELINYAGAPAVLLLVAIIAVVLARPVWWGRALIALLVPLGLALVAYAVLKPDWMAQHRFATPVWALAALVAALAAAELIGRLHRGRRATLVFGLVVALSASAVSFSASAQQFRDQPNISMCYVADRLGRVFNSYADIVGTADASLLLPDLGGSALTSRLRLVDMAGLVEPRIADFINSGDRAGMRDYVFDEVKPTFIHSRGPWSAGNGLPADPRMDRDYHAIYLYPHPGPRNGDWVRKDAVSDPATLAALRSFAQSTMVPVDRADGAGEWPRRHCGENLRPGQTTVGQT
ncbi:hypothetical protein SAMN05216266_11165 [Amycolatopsis marina]|uniref:Glycosyltransferase RgtA/B/C/D-like domain-containing protein n=1 Tax=Amycolatopsis marina TaxID=490629 RepID=A0A1I1AYI3_9PSEU|nr:hypothetical protein [Amycolatopsis marina]SFB43155.1 hypothetical protein SAMN05216266_11165 [Amycolatopsis marina]